MKTDDLVLMRHRGRGCAKHVAARRYTIAWMGMPISFALMLATIGLLSDIRALWHFRDSGSSLALWSALPLLVCCPLTPLPSWRRSEVLPVFALSFPVVILWGLAVITLAQTEAELRIPATDGTNLG